MKKKPETIEELYYYGSESEDILNFLRKYWDGIDDVKPKGYAKFCEDYCDFDGMDEWQDNERGAQEDDFKGFNNNDDGVNFVSTVSLPNIAYNDLCQDRPPIQMLISACVSYGFCKGEIYGGINGERKGSEKEKDEMLLELQKLITNLL